MATVKLQAGRPRVRSCPTAAPRNGRQHVFQTARDSFAFVLHPLAQVEALEELMEMEDPGDRRTAAPRVLWEHRKIEKLLNGFVAVSARPSPSLRWAHENELPVA